MKLDPQATVEARERLGLSQMALAKRAEVASTTVLRAEHSQEIRPISARRLARALGVEVADLYAPKGPAPSPSGRLQAQAQEDRTPREVVEDLRRRGLVTLTVMTDGEPGELDDDIAASVLRLLGDDPDAGMQMVVLVRTADGKEHTARFSPLANLRGLIPEFG